MVVTCNYIKRAKKLYCLQGNSFKQSFAKKTLRKDLVRVIRVFTHKAVARRRSRLGTVHLSSKGQVD